MPDMPDCKSRYRFRHSKKLVNPVFILSSISGSESFFPKTVSASLNLKFKSVAENLNAQGVVAKFVDGWVIFAIDWRRIYVNIEINTI